MVGSKSGLSTPLKIAGKVEEWRDVPGWESCYQVSDQGRVRSLDRDVECSDGSTRHYTGRIMAAPARYDGYPHVGLRLAGRYVRYAVHTLVTEAFLGPRPEGQVVRHLDGNPRNCTIENLAYGTPSENAYDTVRHGRNYYALRARCKWGHLYSGANLAIRRTGKLRMCVACERASSAGMRRGINRKSPEFKALADSYFTKIMEAA